MPVISSARRSSLLWRILKKCAWMAAVLLGITAVSFAVIHLAPGTPTEM